MSIPQAIGAATRIGPDPKHPPRRMIMSARKLLALLVVVLLGLLLASPTAMSRSDLPRYDVTNADGPAFADGDGDDDPDVPDVPNGVVGDDDNWDKSAVRTHGTAERFGGGGCRSAGVGTSISEVELSRMEIGLSVRLAMYLQSWLILSSLR
jgi:hypothetical protein